MLLVRIVFQQIQLAVLTFPSILGVCGSNDYMIIDDYCYQALVGSQNWFRAEIECQKDGGQLISLSGNIKNNSIATHVQYLTGGLFVSIYPS